MTPRRFLHESNVPSCTKNGTKPEFRGWSTSGVGTLGIAVTLEALRDPLTIFRRVSCDMPLRDTIVESLFAPVAGRRRGGATNYDGMVRQHMTPYHPLQLMARRSHVPCSTTLLICSATRPDWDRVRVQDTCHK
jgi:hypothetical protein